MRFKDKIVVVTGAASGFGEAIAKGFGAEGASVVVADVNEVGGKRVTSQLEQAGARALFVRTDVSRDEDVREMV